MKTKEMNKRANERGKEDLKEIKEINRRQKRIKHLLKERDRKKKIKISENERNCTRQSQTDTV